VTSERSTSVGAACEALRQLTAQLLQQMESGEWEALEHTETNRQQLLQQLYTLPRAVADNRLLLEFTREMLAQQCHITTRLAEIRKSLTQETGDGHQVSRQRRAAQAYHDESAR
jgi:hypothetical protein